MTETAVFNPEAHVAGILARQQAVVQRIAESAGRSRPADPLPAVADGGCLRLELVANRDVRWRACWRLVTVDVWDCELQRVDMDPYSETGSYEVSYTVDLVQQQDEFQRITETFGMPYPFASDLQGLRDNPWMVLFRMMQYQDSVVREARRAAL